MIKIESLTKEQEIQLIEFREEWRKHALSCERIDKEATKNCISELYKLIGKKSPVFIFCPSLLFAQYQIEYCKNILPLKNNISHNINDNLFPSLSYSVEDNIEANLYDTLRKNIYDTLRKNIFNNLCDTLRVKLRYNLGDKIEDDLMNNLRRNLGVNINENIDDNIDANLRVNLWENTWANINENLSDNLWSNLRDTLRDNLGENLSDNLWSNLSDNLWSNLRDTLSDNLWANLRVNLSANLRENLRDNLWSNLRYKLGENLSDNLGDNLRRNLRANLREDIMDNLSEDILDNLMDNLGDNLMDNLDANLNENLRNNLWDNLREKIKPPYVSTNLLGSMDAFWISFYEFPEKFLGVEYKTEDKKILNIWSTLAKSCSWFWCYENYCFVSDRPEKLSFNTQNKLHCEDAPAVKWIDGWEIYYWNGIEVPKQWIVDKNSITKETIIKEKNAEKRRCIREIIGTKQYANLIDIKEIDKDHVNGQDVILYRTKEKDDIINEHIYYVNVTCHSTLREYFLCIPKEATKNAWSAVAWTFKMNEQEYKPIIET